jgi:hypothetical protein
VDDHPLAAVLLGAAGGRFPAPDGAFEILLPVDGLAAALVAFTGRTFLAADLDEAEALAHLPGNGLGAPMHPAFIAWLGERLGASCYAPDIVLSAFRAESPGSIALVERPDMLSHPRAAMAQRFRRQVRAYADEDGKGLLTVGHGLCGRVEVSVEVGVFEQNRGLGRRLAYAARTLAPEGEPVFAEVSPGNAASLRAFLAAGYVPIGSEVLLLPGATRNA